MKYLFIFILLFYSCTKNESIGPSEMWSMASKVEPSIELVGIPNHEAHRRVLCSQYRKEGCIPGTGKRIKVRLVELLVIQYETKEFACLAAKDIGQWYFANWVFDDVTNEPVLESFVKEAFNARKPQPNEICED